MNVSAARSGRSARIATRLAPPSSLPSCRFRAGTSRSAIPPSPTASSTAWCTMPIVSRCAENRCAKNAIRRTRRRNESFFYIEKQGIKVLAPLSPAPQIPAQRLLRFAPDALGTLSIDEAEHFRHNHHASVASLRLLFTFAPERRSASLRNRCSPSPEYPLCPMRQKYHLSLQVLRLASFLHALLSLEAGG